MNRSEKFDSFIDDCSRREENDSFERADSTVQTRQVE